SEMRQGDEMTLTVSAELTHKAATHESVAGTANTTAPLTSVQSVRRDSTLADDPEWIRRLTVAANQFIVSRHGDNACESAGRTVIAGYPWFSDWGRDTMIALPGLAIATGRFEDAAEILRTFARYTSQGMLPNRFPDGSEPPEYNTVDAT